jgi:RimJ/RimL family protein N-acetyltransferase
MIETERLYLRKWQMSDAEAVYDLSKEPEIGYNCGWKPHKDVAESRFVLEYILINKNTVQRTNITGLTHRDIVRHVLFDIGE